MLPINTRGFWGPNTLTLGLEALQKLGVDFAEEVHQRGFGGSAGAAGLPRLQGTDPPRFLFIWVWGSTSPASDRHDHGGNLLVGQEDPLLPLEHKVEKDESPKCPLDGFVLSCAADPKSYGSSDEYI